MPYIVETPFSPGSSVGLESETPLSLRAFLENLQGHVAAVSPAWVMAEVIAVQTRGGVVYYELAENDAQGAPLAKVKAKLWQRRETVLAPFRNAAGEDPRPGMRILARLKPSFHPIYGLSLDVEAIDAAYTLGDIERRLSEMRLKLREAGLHDRNRREFPCPEDFARVAVLAPHGAAALGDFREAADRLERAGLCTFAYHHALFQGQRTVESLIVALQQIVREHRRQPFCALCIIRGGGSVADLADLNQYRLAHAVCHVQIPVLTGIGHERDTVILDDVASRRFDTPSKVIGHIQSAIVDGARNAAADWQHVCGETHRLVADARRDAEGARETVATRAVAVARAARGDLEIDRQTVSLSARAVLPRARAEQDADWQAIGSDARRALRDARNSVHADMGQILGLGPRHTVARGFAIVRDDRGRVVANVADARAAPRLAIELRDGVASVQSIGKDDDGNG